MRIFYFGCWQVSGHYLWTPGGHRFFGREDGVVYYGDHIHLDGTLAPRQIRENTRSWCDGKEGIVWHGMGKTPSERTRLYYDSNECSQGQFLLHHLDNGFTAIQWWDRNQGDQRGACNSTVLLEGVRTAVEMLDVLTENFPSVLKNLESACVALVDVTGTI
jgi:hypothetical protein